jgi:hypothetical protein
MNSVYTDSQGTFDFHMLAPNPYTVSIADDNYQPVRKLVMIEATSMAPVVFADITLVPKKTEARTSGNPSQSAGSNPNMVDIHEYAERFPKRL